MYSPCEKDGFPNDRGWLKRGTLLKFVNMFIRSQNLDIWPTFSLEPFTATSLIFAG